MAEQTASFGEIAFAAQLFDGASSQAVPVTVRLLAPDSLHISGDGINTTIAVQHVVVSSRLGNTKRYLTLPDDAKLETADNDAVDRLLERATGRRRHTLLHSIEAHWGRVLAALRPDEALLVMNGLTQANTNREETWGLYRPYEPEKLLRELGIVGA